MSSVSIIHAPRDEALGDKIAAALESAGHAAMRISADPDVGDLDAATVDEGAAIVVWTAAAAKLAKLREQAKDAMARGALIPVAVGRVRPPGGFEKLPPVDLSGWTGAIDDPRWRFVLEEVSLAHQRTLLRDGDVWAEPQNENETENGDADSELAPSGPLTATRKPAPQDAGSDDAREPAAWIDLDGDLDNDGADDADANGLPGFLARQQRRRRGFTARQVALGASGGLVLMTLAVALLLPVLVPAPKPIISTPPLREAPMVASQQEDVAVPDPSPTAPSNLAALRPGSASGLELPLAAPMPIPPQLAAEEDAADMLAETAADEAPVELTAAPPEDADAADAGAPEAGTSETDPLETLIAEMDAEAPPKAALEVPAITPATEEAAESINLGNYFRECVECPDMAALPAGSFRMGAAGQGSQQEVVIANRFAIGTREVTYEQWDACVREGGCTAAPSDHGWGRGKQPVTDVSYDDAVAYANWLSLKTGRSYRLPTEAEWEYAARAGSEGPFAFGEAISARQANFNGQLSGDGPAETFRGRTTPAASFAPNAFGLYDMHGNAWEWTEDCWNASHAGAPADGSARATGDCTQRVLKGGAWNTGGEELRAGHRIGRPIWARENDSGFRVARDFN